MWACLQLCGGTVDRAACALEAAVAHTARQLITSTAACIFKRGALWARGVQRAGEHKADVAGATAN